MSYLSSTVGVLFTFPTSSFGFSLGFALPKSGIFVSVVLVVVEWWSVLVVREVLEHCLCWQQVQRAQTGPSLVLAWWWPGAPDLSLTGLDGPFTQLRSLARSQHSEVE